MKPIAAAGVLGATLIGSPVWAAGAATTAVVYSDSVSVEVDVPPQFLWDEIKRMYVDGDKFRRDGFQVTQIKDDPSAYLGGTLIEKTDNGVLDRREARFTIIDDRQRLLALTAHYNSGETVYASYAIRPALHGSTFQLIFHASMNVPADPGITPSPKSVRARIAAFGAASHKEILDAWAAERNRIEGLARTTPGR